MKRSTIIYTWIYIIIAAGISTIILFFYAKALPELILDSSLEKEMFMCSGQIVWQGIILSLFITKKVTRYICHMITISLLGSLFLIPLILLYQLKVVSLEIRVLLFLLVVLFMILEHSRRVQKLKLPNYLTITWIFYRILWLPILLF